VFAEESTEEVVEEPKTSCEYFDYTLINLFTLEIASQETKQKIEKVEDTIDDETIVRSTILGSLKNLLGLRQTDKVIFREMKKEIADAKAYYENIDQKVVITGKYLDDNIKYGGVDEWFKSTVLKTVVGQLTVSSNLTASAI
jgi:hypothetical protein